MMNIVTIHALRKTSSLSKPLKTLLLSLAVSDLGVGLLSQPLEVVYLSEKLQRIPSSSSIIDKVSAVILSLFYLSSFGSIMAITADRFIAIQMALRYQTLVTHKRVVTVVLTIWLFSIVMSPCTVLTFSPNTTFALFVSIESVLFCIATLFYYKIYLTVRRHKEQIQTQLQQLAQNNEMKNMARLRKSLQSTFYINLVFWACYLPHFFISIARQIHREPSMIINTLYSFAESLVLFNSSLNPIIFCWKMRQIRHAMMGILRNISTLRAVKRN